MNQFTLGTHPHSVWYIYIFSPQRYSKPGSECEHEVCFPDGHLKIPRAICVWGWASPIAAVPWTVGHWAEGLTLLFLSVPVQGQCSLCAGNPLTACLPSLYKSLGMSLISQIIWKGQMICPKTEPAVTAARVDVDYLIQQLWFSSLDWKKFPNRACLKLNAWQNH